MLYEDNTEKVVCGYEISGFDNMKVEPQTVTVIYKGYDNLCYNYKKLRGESMKVNYNSTIWSCFIGYRVQAIVNNFVPLLFITFQSQYSIPLSKITLLITINFGLQLIIDFASAFFIDKIGYRAAAVAAGELDPDEVGNMHDASRRRIAVLEGIVDHTNVGAIFRSAAAMGIDAVLVTPTCCDP